jgi:hypothetical protein
MTITLFTVVYRPVMYAVLMLTVSAESARISEAEELCNPRAHPRQPEIGCCWACGRT